MIAEIALLVAVSSPSPPPDNPYQIYKVAMQRLATLDQPSYIDDTEHWTLATFTGHEEATSEHFQRTIFDSLNRRENVMAVPFSARDEPLIGDSYFAPDTWLMGKRAQPSAPPAQAPNMAPDLSDLRTIASVVTVAKPSYDIRLVGIDSLTGGGTAYHLSFHPLLDPMKHNLRELWINTSTHDIMRAIIEGIYRPTPRDILQDTYVLEDFGRIGPYWLVMHHVWTYGAPFSGRRYQYDVTSTQMQFPERVPDWFFDEAAFEKHLGEVTKALEWSTAGYTTP
ncbi:MAG: hypothetical protein ACXVAF_00185 [Vulcanimicrobiaceae bacterium]